MHGKTYTIFKHDHYSRNYDGYILEMGDRSMYDEFVGDMEEGLDAMEDVITAVMNVHCNEYDNEVRTVYLNTDHSIVTIQ